MNPKQSCAIPVLSLAISCYHVLFHPFLCFTCNFVRFCTIAISFNLKQSHANLCYLMLSYAIVFFSLAISCYLVLLHPFLCINTIHPNCKCFENILRYCTNNMDKFWKCCIDHSRLLAEQRYAIILLILCYHCSNIVKIVWNLCVDIEQIFTDISSIKRLTLNQEL